MGLAKTEWIEAQERGWSAPDTHVCADCVEDSHLKDIIRKIASAYTCDYCCRHAAQAIAAEAGVVIEVVLDTVHAYYGEPTNAGVPYDGGFILSLIDIADVLGELSFEGHPDFLQAVIDAEANGSDFVPVADGHWAGCHPHEVLLSAWHLFSEAIKHETRFHFANAPRSAWHRHTKLMSRMYCLLLKRCVHRCGRFRSVQMCTVRECADAARCGNRRRTRWGHRPDRRWLQGA